MATSVQYPLVPLFANSEFEEYAAYEVIDQEFSLAAFPKSVIEALRKGLESVAIQLAVTFGIRDDVRLANLVFFWRHQERQGRKLAKGEPDFDRLSLEWRDIHGELVVPVVARAATQIKYFNCSKDDLQQVNNYLGKTVTADELRSALDKAVRNAVFWALRAAYVLERSPRSPEARRIFGEVFGVCPEYLPKEYAKAKRKWKDYGELVALRLRSAAKILQGGWIKYYCWNGRTHCKPVPGFAPCAPPTQHYACFGANYSLCLGGFFWDRWNENDDLSLPTMATTVLHEALHIYFHFMQHSGRIANIVCYEVFTLRHNGLGVHQDTADLCQQRPVRCA